MAFAWDALAFVHARLGEHREAISCYQKALALVRERKNPTARGLLVPLLAESGDTRRAAGDLPAAVEAWQQALQVLRELRWPDVMGLAPGSSRPNSPARRADGQASISAVRGWRGRLAAVAPGQAALGMWYADRTPARRLPLSAAERAGHDHPEAHIGEPSLDIGNTRERRTS